MHRLTLKIASLTLADRALELGCKLSGAFSWGTVLTQGALRDRREELRALRAADLCALELGKLTAESHAEVLAELHLRFDREGVWPRLRESQGAVAAAVELAREMGAELERPAGDAEATPSEAFIGDRDVTGRSESRGF